VKRLRAVVRGRVQGVGFRATAAAEARKLDLRGWVRNRTDGSVEVDAQGADAALDAFVGFLHRGPNGARVISVDVEWLPPELTAGTFETR